MTNLVALRNIHTDLIKLAASFVRGDGVPDWSEHPWPSSTPVGVRRDVMCSWRAMDETMRQYGIQLKTVADKVYAEIRCVKEQSLAPGAVQEDRHTISATAEGEGVHTALPGIRTSACDAPGVRHQIPEFFGKLYPADSSPSHSLLGTWVRRAEVDSLLSEIEQARNGFNSMNGAYEALRQRFAKACGEVTRLRSALASIGEYDCPGGMHPNNCPGCAACDANEALSDVRQDEPEKPCEECKTPRLCGVERECLKDRYVENKRE